MKIKKIQQFIILSIFLLIISVSFIAIAEENSNSAHTIFDDPDQDGLTTEEEQNYGTDPNKKDTDGDGYSDGTEVMTGYDPLKPAPGDKIITDSSDDPTLSDGENLTREISEDLVELLAEKSGDISEITLDDLDSIIADINNETLTFDQLPGISDAEIEILEQDLEDLDEAEAIEKTREDTLDYLTTLAYIAACNSPETIHKPDDIESMSTNIISQLDKIPVSGDSSYLLEMSEKAENAYEQIVEVEVPENMVDIHKKGMQMAKYAISLKEEGGIEFSNEDPIQTLLNISKAQQLFNLGISLSTDVNSVIQELGITEIPIDL